MVAVIVVIVYTVGNFAFQFTRGTPPEDGERILKTVRISVKGDTCSQMVISLRIAGNIGEN